MSGVKVDVKWNGPDVKLRGKRVVGKTNYEVGLIVERQAKELCPVGEYPGTGRVGGRLKGSITTQAAAQGTQPKAPATSQDKIASPNDELEVLVGTAVDYGPYVEFGTRNMDSQPFLRPALDLAQGRTLTIARKNGRWEFKDYLERPA